MIADCLQINISLRAVQCITIEELSLRGKTSFVFLFQATVFFNQVSRGERAHFPEVQQEDRSSSEKYLHPYGTVNEDEQLHLS